MKNLELIEQTIYKIDSLLKEQLPESQYQFELFDLASNTKHFRGLNETFHWGSTYKLFVVAEIIKMAEEGLHNLEDEIYLNKEKYQNGIGIIKYLENLNKLTILDACKLVMATSDSVCADTLLERVGFERLTQLFKKAQCVNSKLRVNLDTLVKTLFQGANLNSYANYYQSEAFFTFFNEKLSQLLADNHTTAQDLNQCFYFVFEEYLSETSKKIFMECVLTPNIHSRIGYYTVYSPFTLKGKTGMLATSIVNNECVAIIHKNTKKIHAYFALNTKNNHKRYFQCNDTFGQIGIEICHLYETINQ